MVRHVEAPAVGSGAAVGGGHGGQQRGQALQGLGQPDKQAASSASGMKVHEIGTL